MMIVFTSMARRAARRRAAAIEEELRRQEERRTSGEEPESPFAMLPFGGLFEQLMGGLGAKSYTYDERTGRWVEVTDELPEPEPEPADRLSGVSRAPEGRPKDERPARRVRPRPRPTQQ